jgi:hypothetical protein
MAFAAAFAGEAIPFPQKRMHQATAGMTRDADFHSRDFTPDFRRVPHKPWLPLTRPLPSGENERLAATGR